VRSLGDEPSAPISGIGRIADGRHLARTSGDGAREQYAPSDECIVESRAANAVLSALKQVSAAHLG
jgi:hypothetical protein